MSTSITVSTTSGPVTSAETCPCCRGPCFFGIFADYVTGTPGGSVDIAYDHNSAINETNIEYGEAHIYTNRPVPDPGGETITITTNAIQSTFEVLISVNGGTKLCINGVTHYPSGTGTPNTYTLNIPAGSSVNTITITCGPCP
jgi:hypothetical protein